MPDDVEKKGAKHSDGGATRFAQYDQSQQHLLALVQGIVLFTVNVRPSPVLFDMQSATCSLGRWRERKLLTHVSPVPGAGEDVGKNALVDFGAQRGLVHHAGWNIKTVMMSHSPLFWV